MGERMNSFEIEIEPTAENNASKILDEETFSLLSQTPEGLSGIPEEKFVDFTLEREDIHEFLYISKFISNSELFREIGENSKNKEIVSLSNLFCDVLSSPPSICQLSPVNLEETGLFIAYIYKSNNTKERQLHIAWKENFNKEHLFERLIKKNATSSEEYPNELRSFGAFDISVKTDNVVKIRFYGDASYKEGSEVPGYSPGILRNYRKKFEEIFQKQFPDQNIEIEF